MKLSRSAQTRLNAERFAAELGAHHSILELQSQQPPTR